MLVIGRNGPWEALASALQACCPNYPSYLGVIVRKVLKDSEYTWKVCSYKQITVMNAFENFQIEPMFLRCDKRIYDRDVRQDSTDYHVATIHKK